MSKIYIVEDDDAIRTELALALEHNGYEALACTTFDHVVDDVLEASPDLVLLDLSLPQTDGQFICRELRSHSDVPIIVLTSRTTEVDEVMSMTLGADDFIPKPYSLRVLIARMQALLRRSSSAQGKTVLRHDGLELDVARSRALYEGSEVELTKNELRILSLLMRHAGTIVSREAIMSDLWNSDTFIDDNTLTVNINRLRATLDKIGVHGYLTTHRGQGYSV